MPPNDEFVAFIDAVREPEAPELTIEKLVGVYRVLIPRMIAAYTYHLNGTSPITDAPTIRSLKFILQDEFEDWRDGEMLLQSLIETPEKVERAARRQQELETAHARRRAASPAPVALAAEPARCVGGGSSRMKKFLRRDELARDERFVRAKIEDRIIDPRGAEGRRAQHRLRPSWRADRPAAAERSRSLMHGIFVGEIQALEGAGRTCFDFDDEDAPFQLKLDMARQCWDESRHCEISVKLGDHMGTEIGEFTEATFLYEAACNPDPVLRLSGVNRALEGLAIDVFNTMKEFGDESGDPVLEFCEDWMLADEVTHVKMGSDWLRRLTENDPERREPALEFQRTVDKLFSLGGFRGETTRTRSSSPAVPRARRLHRRGDRRARRRSPRVDRASARDGRDGDGRARRAGLTGT